MLTDRIQAEAVHRLIYTDLPTDDIRPETFREPWKTIFFLAREELKFKSDPAAILTQIMSRVPMNDTDDYWTRVQEITRLIWNAGEARDHQSYDDLNLPPVEWLWTNWLPRGMLSIVGADPGTGKSYLALELCRIVTQGTAWPDGSPVERNGKAIYVEAENVPRLTKGRIAEMAIDARHIYPMLPDDEGILNLNAPIWQERLIDKAADLKPELIVIDSFTSISDVGQNSVEDVNRLLMYLVRLADFANCGMLLVHHLRKPSSAQARLPIVSIHDFRGSGHIMGMIRSGWGLSMQSDNKNGPRRLELVKTNVTSSYPDPLSALLITEDGRKRFEYGKVASPTATLSDECREWLLDLLADGPMRVKDIKAAGRKDGFKPDMVNDVHNDLLVAGLIVNTHGKSHPRNRWALPDWQENDEDSEDSEESEESGGF